jgi:stringent starvation protein B
MYSDLSLRPFLLLAFCDWCEQFVVTPFLVVHVDEHVHVPRAFVKENVIVLNISQDATQKLEIKSDFVRFYARFAGIAHHVQVPIGNVIGCFSSEPQQGLTFDYEPLAVDAGAYPLADRPSAQALEKKPDNSEKQGEPATKNRRPQLTILKK